MATSTGLSSTDSPGPIERFVFGTLPSPSTCTPATFSWTYFGVAHSFSFTISQQIAPHTDRTGATRRAISDVTIASNLQTTDETWTWPSVNVTQGWYVLEALGDTWAIPSAEFFITSGTDVSCLYPTQLPFVSTSKISLSTTSPSPYPSSADVPKTSSAAPSTTHLPAGATGGIIGGVIGFAVLMVIAYIFTRWRSTTRKRRPSTDALSPVPRRRWDPLSSRVSASTSFVIDEKTPYTYTTGDASCRRSLEPNRRPPSASLLHSFIEASPHTTAQASERPLRLDMDISPDPVIILGSVDPVLHMSKVRTSQSVSSIGTLNMDTPTTHISAYSSYRPSTTSSMGRSDDSPAPSSTTSHMYLSGSGMRY